MGGPHYKKRAGVGSPKPQEKKKMNCGSVVVAGGGGGGGWGGGVRGEKTEQAAPSR